MYTIFFCRQLLSKTALTIFFIATTVYCIFEVMLLMYIGILATKGYVSPALAFGFSGGFVRLGALVGNGIAVLFEENPVFGEPLALPCAILFAALTVFLLIPLVRREYVIEIGRASCRERV